MSWRQEDGLATVLPLGLRRIDALRTITTEGLAVPMPFKAQEIRERGGVSYGQNTTSKNLAEKRAQEELVQERVGDRGGAGAVHGGGTPAVSARDLLFW